MSEHEIFHAKILKAY